MSEEYLTPDEIRDGDDSAGIPMSPRIDYGKVTVRPWFEAATGYKSPTAGDSENRPQQ